MTEAQRLPDHDVLVLDFDGVVLESTAIKDQAFHDLFKPAGAAAQKAVLDYHLARPGVNRHIKIRQILRDVLAWPATDEAVTHWCEQYAILVADGLSRCGEVPGVRAYLEGQQKPAYVVSAAPQDEVRDIAASRHFTSLFKAIYGSPRGKPELLRLVARREGVDSSQLLFIGDKLSDHQAARECGTRFIARRQYTNPAPFPPDVCSIADFHDLRPES